MNNIGLLSSTLILIIPKFLTAPTQHPPPITLVHIALAILMVLGQLQLISNLLQLPPHQQTLNPFPSFTTTHFTTYCGPVTSVFSPHKRKTCAQCKAFRTPTKRKTCAQWKAFRAPTKRKKCTQCKAFRSPPT